MQIDLLRHGACEGGAIFRGSTDVPLTAEGWQHMAGGLKKLQGPWQSIVCSPLIRCRAFAEGLATNSNVSLRVDAGIREMSFGDWEGLQVESVWQEHEALCLAWSRAPDQVTPPAGEAYTHFKGRVLNSVLTLVQEYRASEKVLLITHGGVIKLLLNIARGESPAGMMQLNVGYGFAASIKIVAPTFNANTVHILAPGETEYVYQS
ncbi:histidine phosphatase family protein [Gilvimarinus sp. SDUM040013]|uniref:Histidine phosphatase family protein n=1 Tax=Gilvimarinus gilvus TaxID=3058038 RepID=A0ABU4RYW8_9GAMM|nr:histidine phosphatase family protein [Gilvimarinus sp. SDUM040013]MDO3384570.1 histidine phosphatase family protein [Gilvimarinus sp. SDUM040013]MDX6850094.1 histidine phosphatase family protein [Gilvimarinus sp. SDUM040013]